MTNSTTSVSSVMKRIQVTPAILKTQKVEQKLNKLFQKLVQDSEQIGADIGKLFHEMRGGLTWIWDHKVGNLELTIDVDTHHSGRKAINVSLQNTNMRPLTDFEKAVFNTYTIHLLHQDEDGEVKVSTQHKDYYNLDWSISRQINLKDCIESEEMFSKFKNPQIGEMAIKDFGSGIEEGFGLAIYN